MSRSNLKGLQPKKDFLPRTRDCLTLGQAIEAWMNRFEVDQKCKSHLLANYWNRIAGPGVAAETEKVWYRTADRVLCVRLKSPTLKQELRYARTRLRQAFNQLLGDDETIVQIWIM